MRFRLSLLRHQGARMQERAVLCPDTRIESTPLKGFLRLTASRFLTGSSEPVAHLYEPKILHWAEGRVHLMGFELEGEQSFVQEWLLEDFRQGFGREVVPVSPKNRLASSE